MDGQAPDGEHPGVPDPTTTSLASPATRSQNMGLAPLSILLLLTVTIWHIIEAYYSGMGLKNHMTASALSLLLGILGLFITLPGKGELMAYLNNLLDRNRHHLLGLSAVIIGGMHFLTFSNATDVIPMFGFVILLIAYYEFGSLTIRTAPYLIHDNITNNIDGSTRRFIRYSGSKILIALGLTFAMSAFMLFISFMGIVGFTGVWTVLILSALLMASLGMIVRSSNI